MHVYCISCTGESLIRTRHNVDEWVDSMKWECISLSLSHTHTQTHTHTHTHTHTPVWEAELQVVVHFKYPGGQVLPIGRGEKDRGRGRNYVFKSFSNSVLYFLVFILFTFILMSLTPYYNHNATKDFSFFGMSCMFFSVPSTFLCMIYRTHKDYNK